MAKYYLVATLLTTCHTCRYGSVTSECFNLLPPTHEEYMSYTFIICSNKSFSQKCYFAKTSYICIITKERDCIYWNLSIHFSFVLSTCLNTWWIIQTSFWIVGFHITVSGAFRFLLARNVLAPGSIVHGAAASPRLWTVFQFLPFIPKIIQRSLFFLAF